jgi:hypothetical protein
LGFAAPPRRRQTQEAYPCPLLHMFTTRYPRPLLHTFTKQHPCPLLHKFTARQHWVVGCGDTDVWDLLSRLVGSEAGLYLRLIDFCITQL